MNLPLAFHRILRKITYNYVRRIWPHVTILNMHQISSDFQRGIHLPYTWTSKKALEKALKNLKREFEFISLSEINSTLDNRPTKNYAVVTFDDGDKGVLEAIPILEKLDIPCTLFINTAYLDDKAGSWIDCLAYAQRHVVPKEILDSLNSLRKEIIPSNYQLHRKKVEDYFNSLPNRPTKYLTKDQLWQINSSLVTVGLHGHEHQRQSMMPMEWNKANLEKCFEILSKHPRFVPFYAIPFGKSEDWNMDVVRDASNLGLIICTHSGGVNFTKSPILKRIPFDGAQKKLYWNFLR